MPSSLSIRNYMNDSLRTDVFLRFSAETVACACIYLSSRSLQVHIPLLAIQMYSMYTLAPVIQEHSPKHTLSNIHQQT